MAFDDSAFGIVSEFYKKGIKPGTETTRQVLKNLNFPERALKIIHIAGTNGKGSVAEYLTQILIAAGKKVGTYTSPFVYDYHEQFRINGLPVEDEKLKKYFRTAVEAARGLDASGFELETAGVIYGFKEEGCEYAVIECGMGGKLDATNAISQKELAVLTSVSLEHTAFLGKTLKEICEQKAGIIVKCPAVASGYQSAETLAYLGGKGVKFADKPVEVVNSSLNGQTFTYGGFGFFTQMLGRAQLYNAATAIEAARLLNMPENAIYAGVKSAKLGGRLEILKACNTTFILDGAHNPAAFAPLCEVLELTQGAGVAVYGSLADKDIDKNISALKGRVGEIYAVTPNSPRAMQAGKVVEACKIQGIPAREFESVSAALTAANKSAKTVAVCGTFTILKEAMEWIERK